MFLRRPSKRRLLLYVAGAALAVLVLAQLVLPRIAASKIHSRLDRYGLVKSVKVSAWPAIELLWGHADSVDVRAGALALAPARIAPLLHEAEGAATLKLRATSVRLGGLRLTEVGLDKHGSRLSARALAAAADVQAALPGMSVKLLGSHDGEVEVRAGGALFGVSTSLDAVAQASAGKIVVHPTGFLLGALGLTLYSDPRVYVTALAASSNGRTPPTYRLSAVAVLR